MAKEIKNLLVNLEVGFSMWEALKIRISGIFKNAELVEQVGNVTKITYTKK